MKRKEVKRYVPVLAAIALSGYLFAGFSQEVNDSVVKELEGVTVTGDMQTMSSKSARYYPTVKMRQASQNAIDLLQRLSMNQILINPVTREVTTTLKDPVDIFINFQSASQGDLEGLRTADVRSVEYHDYPTDPRFKGKKHVVNIVVRQYEYGGYTKLSDSQDFISNGRNTGSIFSKFSYRRMTYDLYIGGEHSYDSHFNSFSDSRYVLSDGVVERMEDVLNGRREELRLPVAFRATYSNRRNIQIENTVGFSFDDLQQFRRDGALSFVPSENSAGYSFNQSMPYINRSLSWSGAYTFQFRNDWSLYVSPTFSYSHNNSFSSYSTDIPGSETIVNNAREDGYNAGLAASVSKTISGQHYLSLYASGFTSENDVDYLGSSPARTDNSFTQLDGALNYSFYPGGAFSLDASLGLSGTISSTNGLKDSNLSPTAYVGVNYSPTGKSRLEVGVQYYNNPIGGFSRADNTLQINELLYQTGNPALHDYGTLIGNVSYTYAPLNELSFQAFGRYFGCYDRLVNTYIPYKDGRYILLTARNSGDFNRLYAGLNITGRLFSNRLTLQATPNFTHSESLGYYSMARNHFSWNVNAYWYFGNFNVSASYNSREYTMGVLTGDYMRNAAFYYLQAGWSNNDWNVSLSAYNFFRRSYVGQWTDFQSPFYSSSTISNISIYHSTLRLSATYTFGYGKRVERGSEISEQAGVSSAIMK